jgi:MFS transporter, putative metabolite:H+ symporter
VMIVLARRGLKESPQFDLELRMRALRKAGKSAEADRLAVSYGVEREQSASLASIFRGRALRNTVVLGFAWIVNWFGIQVFSVLGTTVLTQAKHASLTSSLLMLIIVNAVGYLGYVFHGWIGDRFGRRNVIAVGWIVSGIFFALALTLATGTVAVVVLYSLGMFFLVGPYAAMLFYMGECYDTATRATGTGFLNALSQPGAIVAGAIVTVLLAHGGGWGQAALVVGAAGTFVSGFVMFAARKVQSLQG